MEISFYFYFFWVVSCWMYTDIQKKHIGISNICLSILHFPNYGHMYHLIYLHKSPPKNDYPLYKAKETECQMSKISWWKSKRLDPWFPDSQLFLFPYNTVYGSSFADAEIQNCRVACQDRYKIGFCVLKSMLEPKMTKYLDSWHGTFKWWKIYETLIVLWKIQYKAAKCDFYLY